MWLTMSVPEVPMAIIGFLAQSGSLHMTCNQVSALDGFSCFTCIDFFLSTVLAFAALKLALVAIERVTY